MSANLTLLRTTIAQKNFLYYPLIQCVGTCRRICVEEMIKWLLFCISSSLIWSLNLDAQTGIPASENATVTVTQNIN